MKQQILSRALLFLLALCLLLPAGSLAENGKEFLVPDFTLSDQYGKTHSLSDYRGKTVLVNFWATWCPYCLEEMSDLEEIYQETGKNQDEVVVLGIASPGIQDPNMDEAGIAAFLKEIPVTYPVLMDTDGKLFRFYASEGLPTSLLIRPDGCLKYVIPGYLEKDRFMAVIRDAQGEK